MEVVAFILFLLLLIYAIWATMRWKSCQGTKEVWKASEAAYQRKCVEHSRLSNEVTTLKDQKTALENFRSDAVENINQLTGEATEALNRRDAAVAEAEAALKAEGEKRRSEFEEKLNTELEAIKAEHPVAKYKQTIEELENRISKARSTMQVVQKQAQAEAEQEDFVATHSIGLDDRDLHDIGLIREFAPNLTRQEAFSKLIWTEFYQKPLQALCKSVFADKVCGIYKITHIGDKRMYIGQAVDIGTRWKEHCKCALGIGSTSYMSNKFYKAMHDKGPENFTFEVLEPCDRSLLDERERYWIEFFDSTAFGYNTKIGG